MSARAVLAEDGTTVVERLHVARKARDRMRGLLGRDALPEDEGMWLPACRLIHTFRMRFPIDVVYLDEQLEVCKVVEGLRPGRVSACLSAESVLELSSGTALRRGLRRGVRLEIIE